MKVPDEMWKCPKCGAGYEKGEGLLGPDYTTYEEFVAEYGTDDGVSPDEYGECECCKCGWSGHVTKVVKAAQKKAQLVKCPHCKGTGMVKGSASVAKPVADIDALLAEVDKAVTNTIAFHGVPPHMPVAKFVHLIMDSLRLQLGEVREG